MAGKGKSMFKILTLERNTCWQQQNRGVVTAFHATRGAAEEQLQEMSYRKERWKRDVIAYTRFERVRNENLPIKLLLNEVRGSWPHQIRG